MNKDKLVIGSAGKQSPDAVTVDIDPLHRPDVVHDLAVEPWPFEDNAFGQIVAHHVLEHFQDIGPVMRQMHRVCRPGGTIYIEVPHHTSWCAKDPFHRGFYGYFSLDGYLEGQPTWMTDKKFRCVKRELAFHKFYRFFLLHKLFNAFPMFYERFVCYMFPAEFFKIWLTPQK